MNIITSLRSTVWKTGALNFIQSISYRRHDVQRNYYGITKHPSLINMGSIVLKNEGLQLLTPKVPILLPSSGFKVKKKLKRRCKDCYFVVRQRRVYVICETHPRHKQMSMKHRINVIGFFHMQLRVLLDLGDFVTLSMMTRVQYAVFLEVFLSCN